MELPSFPAQHVAPAAHTLPSPHTLRAAAPSTSGVKRAHPLPPSAAAAAARPASINTAPTITTTTAIIARRAPAIPSFSFQKKKIERESS